jgi:hypothetical protein
VGKMINGYTVLYENLKERDQLEELKHTEKDNIGNDLGKIGWEGVVDLSGSEYGPVAGSCEHGNESSVSIKAGRFSSLDE